MYGSSHRMEEVMTKAGEVIERVNTSKPDNAVDDELKFEWINRLEKIIYDKVFSKAEDTNFPYTEKVWKTDLEADLLIPEPYTEMYLYYIFAKMDFNNGEIGGYNNNMSIYNDLYDDFAAWYRRNHMPKQITV